MGNDIKSYIGNAEEVSSPGYWVVLSSLYFSSFLFLIFVIIVLVTLQTFGDESFKNMAIFLLSDLLIVVIPIFVIATMWGVLLVQHFPYHKLSVSISDESIHLIKRFSKKELQINISDIKSITDGSMSYIFLRNNWPLSRRWNGGIPVYKRISIILNDNTVYRFFFEDISKRKVMTLLA